MVCLLVHMVEFWRDEFFTGKFEVDWKRVTENGDLCSYDKIQLKMVSENLILFPRI